MGYSPVPLAIHKGYVTSEKEAPLVFLSGGQEKKLLVFPINGLKNRKTFFLLPYYYMPQSFGSSPGAAQTWNSFHFPGRLMMALKRWK